MLIPPKYFLTPKISHLLSQIEGSKAVIDSTQIPVEIETNIRRKSTLKSSLFSARIEGNQLTLDDLNHSSSSDQRKKEVFNILKALDWIFGRSFRDLSSASILYIHKQVMDGLLDKLDLGKFRSDIGAIFNSAGIAVYLPPRPSQISSLINKLVTYSNATKEPFVPIKAMLTHFTFEKIHPFLDGNGRVGRILIQAVLQKGGYGMKGLLSIEEYLDNHRTDYYEALDSSEKDVTDYLEFMLEALSVSSGQARDEVLKKNELEAGDYLLPRRAEILNIIKDHNMVNFDTLRRRFMGVNERTLRYDLKKLQDASLIRKRGTTKGVYYEII